MNDPAPVLRYRGDGSTPSLQQPGNRHGQTGRYFASKDVVSAVNTALIVEQPLLVVGEPGVGKTALAWSIASELGLGSVLEFHTRSQHQARDLLYTYDALHRLLDVQLHNVSAQDASHYVTLQALGQGIKDGQEGRRRVVLIDEIDKAPRDFPNDLLNELDQAEFTITETGAHYRATMRPFLVITSNSERQLPDAFLRRCVFCFMRFPSAEHLSQILFERLSSLNVSSHLCDLAVSAFLKIRRLPDLDKLPATAELIGWMRVLLREQVDVGRLATEIPISDFPALGMLLKTQLDYERVAQRG